MAIKDWPEDQRPREKLLRNGPASLSDPELLAIFLRVGVKGRSAVDLSRDLIEHFGSLTKLLEADSKTFCQAHGLGEAKYVQLQASVEMAKRYFESSMRDAEVISNPEMMKQYLSLELRGYPREVFAMLSLDTRHRTIQFDKLFFGTIDGASVYPREVVKRALENNAAAVVFAHNHPSGIAEPSQADEQITSRLKAALELIDIRVLDHIIIGDGQVVSFAERGLI